MDDVTTPLDSSPENLPSMAPFDFRSEVADYDCESDVAEWNGPRFRMRYRTLGDGPALVVLPGIASTYRGYAPTLNRLAPHLRTIIADYPGENHGDGANLREISHDHLVDDLIGLLDHLNIDRAHLFGLSFGSTVALRALAKAPERFGPSIVQGAFAHRRFTPVDRAALQLGRVLPGTTDRLPFRELVLRIEGKAHFTGQPADRWQYYVEQNGLTPIHSMAHRIDLLTRLDLRPTLPAIAQEVLLLQGDRDKIVPVPNYHLLLDRLPNARGVLMAGVGHQPHFTHPEWLAREILAFLSDDRSAETSVVAHSVASFGQAR
jgi:pimeloyl-ACP methyl ester carboxylesterase